MEKILDFLTHFGNYEAVPDDSAKIAIAHAIAATCLVTAMAKQVNKRINQQDFKEAV